MSAPSAAHAAVAEDAGELSAPALNGDVVVQYVVLRRDLIEAWPLGSVVAQGCHAAVAAVWAHRDHPDTLAYCSPSNLDSMHKVTLEVKGEAQLRSLAEKLEASGVEHKLWIEQPENIPTCLATRPCPKSQVALLFKKLKLCKDRDMLGSGKTGISAYYSFVIKHHLSTSLLFFVIYGSFVRRVQRKRHYIAGQKCCDPF